MSLNGDSRRKHIHIGIATFADVDPEVMASMMSWSFHLGRRMREYDFSNSIAPKMAQWRAKNQLVENAKYMRADYLLVLDDDMLLNIDMDWMRVLLKHDKDVIGPIYFQRGGNYHPVIMKAIRGTRAHKNELHFEFYERGELSDGLMQVDVLGGGCQLIKMEVFTKIISPYFFENGVHGQDVYFCQKVREAGMESYVDTSVQVGHMVRDRYTLTRETLPSDDFIKSTPYYKLYKERNEDTRRDIAAPSLVPEDGAGRNIVA